MKLLVELAQQRGVTPAQIALAGLLHQPGVTAPITGAGKMNHLEDALFALEIELTQEECQRGWRNLTNLIQYWVIAKMDRCCKFLTQLTIPEHEIGMKAVCS